MAMRHQQVQGDCTRERCSFMMSNPSTVERTPRLRRCHQFSARKKVARTNFGRCLYEFGPCFDPRTLAISCSALARSSFALSCSGVSEVVSAKFASASVRCCYAFIIFSLCSVTGNLYVGLLTSGRMPKPSFECRECVLWS